MTEELKIGVNLYAKIKLENGFNHAVSTVNLLSNSYRLFSDFDPHHLVIVSFCNRVPSGVNHYSSPIMPMEEISFRKINTSVTSSYQSRIGDCASFNLHPGQNKNELDNILAPTFPPI